MVRLTHKSSSVCPAVLSDHIVELFIGTDKPKFHYADFPVTSATSPRQTRDVPFSPNSIKPTLDFGIRPKGDVTSLSPTSRGSRHSGIWALQNCTETLNEHRPMHRDRCGVTGFKQINPPRGDLFMKRGLWVGAVRRCVMVMTSEHSADTSIIRMSKTTNNPILVPFQISSRTVVNCQRRILDFDRGGGQSSGREQEWCDLERCRADPQKNACIFRSKLFSLN